MAFCTWPLAVDARLSEPVRAVACAALPCPALVEALSPGDPPRVCSTRVEGGCVSAWVVVGGGGRGGGLRLLHREPGGTDHPLPPLPGEEPSCALSLFGLVFAWGLRSWPTQGKGP